MVECIFTLDYEIYGDGSGSLNELVYEPAQKLIEIFERFDAPFVCFVEVAELERIEEFGTDAAIPAIRRQIRDLYMRGMEIALHIHPQWYNGTYENGSWHLDAREYNLCLLPAPRMSEILERAAAYLRNLVGESGFSPISFRAGNWLLQPTKILSEMLVRCGIKIDSSVFKGGLQRYRGLDYRAAPTNPYFWQFSDDVTVPDENGVLLEIPTYSTLVPSWQLATRKRRNLQRKSKRKERDLRATLCRLLDLSRFYFPLKLDFCRMTMAEVTAAIERVLADDAVSPGSYKPIVAIGHTKDLVDSDTVEAFLSYLASMKIGVVNLQDTLRRIRSFERPFTGSAARRSPPVHHCTHQAL